MRQVVVWAPPDAYLTPITVESRFMSKIKLSPDAIMQLGLGFWASRTLLSAVEFGLFTTLARGPLEGEELRQRLGVHRRSARDFFDALVALGMLVREGDRYANTPDTDHFLDRGKPSYIGGLLEMAVVRLYPSWLNLTAALRSGQPQNEAREGGDPFAAIYADPKILASFLQGMTAVSLPVAAALAERFPWARYRTVIDIGVAEGGVPVALAQAHPHLTGGGFDLPPVKPVFEAYVRKHGLADRLRFHAGDFMTGPLPGADVLVMGHILHDWDLEQKRMLLAKAHAALPAGGALIVYDRMIDDERRVHIAGLLMSLNMLIETPGGFDYTGADCRGWLREGGFAEARVEPLTGPYSMAVAIK
jgi:hypothetical protein